MNSSTLLFIAGFFFFLGVGIVSLIWILVALIRSIRRKSTGGSVKDPSLAVITSLMRDNTTKELVVEMEGKTYKNVQELSPSQLRRLSFTSNVLVKWLSISQAVEGQVHENQPTSSSPQDVVEPATGDIADTGWQLETSGTPEPVTQPFLPDEPNSPIQPLPVVLAVAAEQTPVTVEQPVPDLSDWIPAESIPDQSPSVPPFFYEPEPEVKPVSTKIPDLVTSILTPAPSPTPVFKSIAMQINDILQDTIQGTPYEGRGLTVNDGPDHGVVVTLDGQKYSGVKEVPDEEVRGLIRSAVLEWEKQGKGGDK